MDDPATAPLLTDDQAAVIRQWAELHRDQLRAVLLYGSRFSGRRTPKLNPPAIPDVDIAVSVSGPDDDAAWRDSILISNRRTWSRELAALLNLPVEIVSADPDADPTVYVFLREHGYRVLWRDPEQWTPRIVEG